LERQKIAVIGAGRRSSAHFPAIVRMKDIFDLVAVCDVSEEYARRATERYGGKAYTDLLAMLENDKPDIADICTPGDSHHVIANFVAEHEVNMIVETPVAITLPLIDLMIKAAERHDVKLECAENVWRFPEERMKREILNSGMIGRVARVSCVNKWGGYHAMNALRSYASFREAGWVMGRTKTWDAQLVRRKAGPIMRESSKDSWLEGLIEFEDNILGIYSQGRSRIHYTEIVGLKGWITNEELCILEGGTELAYPMNMVKDAKGNLHSIEVDTRPKITWENPFKKYGNHVSVAVVDELMSIAEAVAKDQEPEYGALNARKDQELSIAISESALKESPLNLPLTTITSHEQMTHERYEQTHGYDPFKVDELLRVHFPML